MQEQAVTIIGAGPAGIAAAVQLKRGGISPLVVEKACVGGLLRDAHWVENYPGFPDGIAGPDLVARFERQLAGQSPEIFFAEVTHVELDGRAFCVATKAGCWRSRIVIVASGTRPRMITDTAIGPGTEGRLFSEIHPLRHAAGKRIAIVGAGDAAFDYALNLGKCNDVLVLGRSETPRCLPLLRERAARAPRITFRNGAQVRRIAAGSGGLDIESVRRGKPARDPADFLIFAIGREPQNDFLSETVRQRQEELERSGRLFLVGDVHNGLLRQTAIAVGDGVRAAMQIISGQEDMES